MRQCLAKICVEAATQPPASLPTDEEVATCVPGELQQPITDTDIGNGRWNLRFDFPDPPRAATFLINSHEFAERRIDRAVRLGSAEEWVLQTLPGQRNAAGHPFHIHVNPFQHQVAGVVSASLSTAPDGSVPAASSTKITDLKFGSATSYQPGDTIMFCGTPAAGPAFVWTTKVTADSTVGSLVNDLNAALQALCPGSDHVVLASQGNIIAGSAACELMSLTTVTNGAFDTRLSWAPQVVDRIWRDTLLVPTGGTETVRMRFMDYPGKTVLHCHIVDHEDQGMMKNILIARTEKERLAALGEPIRDAAYRATTLTGAAPAFQLPDAGGARHSVADSAGAPTVLVFIRGVYCAHCLAQLAALAEARPALQQLGARVMVISSDTPEELAEALGPSDGTIPFSLLAGGASDVFLRYGCFAGEPQHGTFVLTANNEIAWGVVGQSPFMDVERILLELSQAKACSTKNATSSPP